MQINSAAASHRPAPPPLELVVTTCCGRDLSWLGKVFSATSTYSTWQRVSQWEKDQKKYSVSLTSLLGQHAHLRIYDKGGNASTTQALLQQVQQAGMTHIDSASVEALPNANGREAHTITHHCTERWNELATITTFLQGDPKPNHVAPLVFLHLGLLNASRDLGLPSRASRDAFSAKDARAIVERLRDRMNAAAPSTTEASLCNVGQVPPLLCEAGERSPDFRAWPCPTDFHERARSSARPLHHLGGYTSLVGFVMRHFLHEHTTPGTPIPICLAGSLSATREQVQRHKPAEWWAGLRQLLEYDHKINRVSALRMAHVMERMWVRVFSGAPEPVDYLPQQRLALPPCFDNQSATCCVSPTECCCPSKRIHNNNGRSRAGAAPDLPRTGKVR